MARRRGFYGRSTAQYRSADFRLAESTYEERSALPLHAHARAHFCLVLSGSYIERLEGHTVERRPGDLIFYQAGVGHAESHEAAGRHFLIEIDRALAARLEGGGRERSWQVLEGAPRDLATRLFGEFRRASFADRDLSGSLIARLVEEAGRRPAPREGSAWLRDVERRLRERAAGSPDLRELADEAGVHPVYLGRVFRAAYGCTPGEFTRRLRVERAQRALGAERVELADVAHAAGFCDQSHLNRVFKRHTGMTPGCYRRLVSAAPTESY